MFSLLKLHCDTGLSTTFFEYIRTEYPNLIYMEVRWLNNGKIMGHFIKPGKVKTILKSKN
jgi:hypothetical protein